MNAERDIIAQLLAMDEENRRTPAHVVTRQLPDGRWCADDTRRVMGATGKTRQEAIDRLVALRERSR